MPCGRADQMTSARGRIQRETPRDRHDPQGRRPCRRRCPAVDAWRSCAATQHAARLSGVGVESISRASFGCVDWASDGPAPYPRPCTSSGNTQNCSTPLWCCCMDWSRRRRPSGRSATQRHPGATDRPSDLCRRPFPTSASTPTGRTPPSRRKAAAVLRAELLRRRWRGGQARRNCFRQSRGCCACGISFDGGFGVGRRTASRSAFYSVRAASAAPTACATLAS